MITCKRLGLILLWLSISSLFAQPTEYLIIDAPIGAQSTSKVLWVKWAGIARIGSPAPDSGFIYYDRAPGGGNLINYRYKINNPWVDTLTNKKQDNILESSGSVQKRGTAFVAEDQKEMGSGVFYCIVAFPYKKLVGTTLVQDTFISNEFNLMIESPEPVNCTWPKDTISDLTPTFQWDANPGVPYYHVILSDDAIKVDTNDSGNVDLQGLSIIWQAITPNTQMVYGAPDPSKTITADPPPLSPGKRYTWIVLNNFGINPHPAFSSAKIKLPPKEFVIRGKTLAKPKPVYPVNTSLNSTENEKFTFKWTNLDPAANTYKVYAYIGTDFEGSLEGINAQLIVWQTEVSASSNSDTMGVEINALSTLTSNKYVWNVIAVDDKGAGTVGDTAGFRYSASTGTIKVHTRELIRVPKGDLIDTVINPVGLVEVKVEVLDGSLETPLLFYTDLKGDLSRVRPTGAYRITAINSDFESQTKTITLKEGQTLDTTFYLERPDATIKGKIVDEAGKGISLVKVFGVSDLNDTVSTEVDAAGNFKLKCYASDWRIWPEMTGYAQVLPSKVTVASGQYLDFGFFTMKKNPYTLSGTVKNSAGDPLLGVKVTLFQNGIQIDQIANTPQNGTFSFSIPAGTYSISAEITGFSSYTTEIDMLSSKSVTITMQPGATVINGFVYGKTWVTSRDDYVLAPITNATVKFLKIGTADTLTIQSNSTYGSFKISLPGEQQYLVLSSANGFGAKAVPCTLKTLPKTTQNFFDTLNAFATVSGTVKMSGTPLGNCNVNLLKIPEGIVLASGKTSLDGKFEIRNIVDGNYSLMAGKDGYVLDSIAGKDTLNVTSGKPDKSTIEFYVKAGNKKVKWYATMEGSVKLQSPLLKTLGNKDSISNAGAGVYILSYDAKADSIIDCAYHRFTLFDSEMVHIDTIPLLLRHKKTDSISPVNGFVPLSLTSTDSLDSVMIFYKDITMGTYSVSRNYLKNSNNYIFNVLPQRDGSTMLYYFKGYKGSNIYGYDKETYNVFVKPDTSRLSKFEVALLSQDTMTFPSAYNISLRLKGYYSSSFIPDTVINEQSIQWTLANAQGCILTKNTGTTAIVRTGNTGTSSIPVSIIVTIDTSKTKLAAGLSPVDTFAFKVSGTTIKSIRVRRIDAGNPNPITTSVTERAEFTANGVDEFGKILKISPAWKLLPENAGIINSEGVFKPSRNFIGNVRVVASANNLTGEYISDMNELGLKVRFMIQNKSVADTAMNGKGCAIIFPPNIVNNNDIGILELTQDTLENKIERQTGKYKVISSDAYEIKQLENISFNTSSDSIQLLIDLPGDQKSNKAKYYIGNWNIDSLQWQILTNSIVKNSSVSAKLAHFSKYTILTESQNSGYLRVGPNPFSPYVNQRQINPSTPYYGTCIKFQIQSQKQVSAKIGIYNNVGDLVWSMKIPALKSSPYAIWWDGKSISKEIIPKGSDEMSGKDGEIVIVPKGDKMCRNGRYFIIVTGTEDIDKKTYRYMKPVVLMK